MFELEDFNDLLENNESMKPLVNMITQIMEIPEDSLTNTTIESILGAVEGAFTPSLRENTIQEIIKYYEADGFSVKDIEKQIKEAKEALDELVDELNPSEKKRQLLAGVFDIFYGIFDKVIEHYKKFNIELPIFLEEGAKIPTYAHDGDAAADLYAAETVTIPGLSFGNMIRTGVHIALPERWVAYIVPRSSIGAKTPLRLSNSVGVIDSGYRGPLGVLYDNISDSDYTINAGDRIAQLIVMPSYNFKAKQVDALDETERGEDGFGSSGK
jgi:dUTP pyrophosphatase